LDAEWNGIDAFTDHQRVRRPGRPVQVELFLQERIDKAVQREWHTGWLPDAMHSVQDETARALNKRLDTRAADLERCIRHGIEQGTRPFDFKFFLHLTIYI
jgi:hypothetical protein